MRMLDRGKRSLWSDGSQSTVDVPRPEPRDAESKRSTEAGKLTGDGANGRRAAFIQPRVAVAFALIVAGVSWALIRGLGFYGVAPVNLVYDLDQPPLLLMLVAAWLLYRSRRR